jgi:hypothetical protein
MTYDKLVHAAILFFTSTCYHNVNINEQDRESLYLWCVSPLSTIFQLYIVAISLYWWRKPEKTIDVQRI